MSCMMDTKRDEMNSISSDEQTQMELTLLKISSLGISYSSVGKKGHSV